MKRLSILSFFLFATVVIAPALVAAYPSDEMNPNAPVRYYKISIPERRFASALFYADGTQFQREFNTTFAPAGGRSAVQSPLRRYPRTNFITPQRKSFSIRYKPNTQLPLVVRQRNIRKRPTFKYERFTLGY